MKAKLQFFTLLISYIALFLLIQMPPAYAATVYVVSETNTETHYYNGDSYMVLPDSYNLSRHGARNGKLNFYNQRLINDTNDIPGNGTLIDFPDFDVRHNFSFSSRGMELSAGQKFNTTTDAVLTDFTFETMFWVNSSEYAEYGVLTYDKATWETSLDLQIHFDVPNPNLKLLTTGGGGGLEFPINQSWVGYTYFGVKVNNTVGQNMHAWVYYQNLTRHDFYLTSGSVGTLVPDSITYGHNNPNASQFIVFAMDSNIDFFNSTLIQNITENRLLQLVDNQLTYDCWDFYRTQPDYMVNVTSASNNVNQSCYSAPIWEYTNGSYALHETIVNNLTIPLSENVTFSPSVYNPQGYTNTSFVSILQCETNLDFEIANDFVHIQFDIQSIEFPIMGVSFTFAALGLAQAGQVFAPTWTFLFGYDGTNGYLGIRNNETLHLYKIGYASLSALNIRDWKVYSAIQPSIMVESVRFAPFNMWLSNQTYTGPTNVALFNSSQIQFNQMDELRLQQPLVPYVWLANISQPLQYDFIGDDLTLTTVYRQPSNFSFQFAPMFGANAPDSAGWTDDVANWWRNDVVVPVSQFFTETMPNWWDRVTTPIEVQVADKVAEKVAETLSTAADNFTSTISGKLDEVFGDFSGQINVNLQNFSFGTAFDSVLANAYLAKDKLLGLMNFGGTAFNDITSRYFNSSNPSNLFYDWSINQSQVFSSENANISIELQNFGFLSLYADLNGTFAMNWTSIYIKKPLPFLDLAFKALAPLILLLIFPILIAKFWSKKGVGIGLVLGAIILTLSGTITGIQSLGIILAGICMTIILMKMENDSGNAPGESRVAQSIARFRGGNPDA